MNHISMKIVTGLLIALLLSACAGPASGALTRSTSRRNVPAASGLSACEVKGVSAGRMLSSTCGLRARRAHSSRLMTEKE